MSFRIGRYEYLRSLSSAIVTLVLLGMLTQALALSVTSATPPASLKVENAHISLILLTTDVTLSVADKRTGQTWSQKLLFRDLILKEASVVDKEIRIVCNHIVSGVEMNVHLYLDEDHPEFLVTISCDGAFLNDLRFPHPFVTDTGTYLVVPMNEGVSYPVDDMSIEPMKLVAYAGHMGISMAFWGVTDGERGHMAIIETPDDAYIQMDRSDGKLCVYPGWSPQKGQFGYARRIRYIFFDRGGHVAIAKRYQTYAKTIGLFKTLEQKRNENPNVDLLIGAVNVWSYENPLEIIPEMKSAGIDRVLWSGRVDGGPQVGVREMNEMGILTSRYDCYEEVMNPENFKFLNGINPNWITEAWPRDIAIGADGNWIRGWAVKGNDGQWYDCGILSDRQALSYAKTRILDELKAYPYRARFVDITTAAPWREDYSPDHSMTRSESRYWRTELLRLVSQDMRLVTGSETGHDAAVPYVHYFEGMLSLVPYRVPDAGRDVSQIWDQVPELVAKFQVGPGYRLPLWELVYHDCVVAQWYWGDYSNKIPALWDKKDLFNILYGTPPMFMFNQQIWQENQARFVRSYRNVCPVARSVGYFEMVDHRFLTQDRSVQKTVFANGVTVTVNFGSVPYRLPDGTEIPPMGYYATLVSSTDSSTRTSTTSQTTTRTTTLSTKSSTSIRTSISITTSSIPTSTKQMTTSTTTSIRTSYRTHPSPVTSTRTVGRKPYPPSQNGVEPSEHVANGWNATITLCFAPNPIYIMMT